MTQLLMRLIIRPKTPIRICPSSSESMKVQVTLAWVVKRFGPGNRPWMSRPPSSTAAVGLPGMLSVSSGTSDGPTTALFAASEAITPSGSPLPKLSRRELNFRHWS